ncbi:MAG TPA: UDP-N-acetylglucosamine 2-epimerase (non-hydrolyzing) [Gammaproteobacteria bacterium]|nr:UDP-N-acetylglucosamine 2-epimerase (non-hydrolyzing) [Gammaproteobacteria bacterium]
MKTSPVKVFFVFGTRPEAIKLAPVIHCFNSRPGQFESVVAVTGQHREMLEQVLRIFRIEPDYDLDVMQPDQSLAGLTARVLERLDPLLAAERPQLLIVQGDTTTTYAAALAAFYRGIQVAHVEAGLRTGDLGQPFPEEANRVMTSIVATLHFPPTSWARDNLLREGIEEDSIRVTGNTVIDALFHVLDEPYTIPERLASAFAADGLRRVLLTCHRRENHGRPVRDVCDTIIRLLDSFPDVSFVVPVHLNPNVRGPIYERLGSHERIHLVPPLDYQDFVQMMGRVDLIISDSGGVQEEAPSLGKPVLLLRNTTERPEAVTAGTVRLVGTDPERLFVEASRLLGDRESYLSMSRAGNPYGDGRAAHRIADAIHNWSRGARLNATAEMPGLRDVPDMAGYGAL